MKILEKLRGRGKEEGVAEEMGEKLLEAKIKLKSGVVSAEKRRTNAEKELEKLRTEAKEALRVGNQVAFKKTTRRYGMLSERANTLSTLEEFIHSNLMVIENAEFANWIGKMLEKDLNPALELLKLDDPKLKENFEKLNKSRERLASKMDMVSETIELSTHARSYQKVASEKERSGDNGLAAILYLKSAKYYVDAVKVAKKESDRSTWKRLCEYCLSKYDTLKFAGKRGRGVTGEASGSIPPINAEEGLKNYVESFIVSTEQIEADLEDVAGLKDAKSIINDLKIAIEHPEVLERHPKLRPPQGILLYGPPGCGKTYFAGAIAKNIDATFFYVSAAASFRKSVQIEMTPYLSP